MEHLRTIKTPYQLLLSISIKIAQSLVNTGFALIILSERAEVRTPDNLIKSQVIKTFVRPVSTGI